MATYLDEHVSAFTTSFLSYSCYEGRNGRNVEHFDEKSLLTTSISVSPVLSITAKKRTIKPENQEKLNFHAFQTARAKYFTSLIQMQSCEFVV